MLHVSIRKFSSFAFLLLLSSWQHQLGYSGIVQLYDDTDPSEDNLRVISDTEHIKEGLKAIFHADEALGEQSYPVIAEHLEWYVEYWLEFYTIRTTYLPEPTEQKLVDHVAFNEVALLKDTDASDIFFCRGCVLT